MTLKNDFESQNFVIFEAIFIIRRQSAKDRLNLESARVWCRSCWKILKWYLSQTAWKKLRWKGTYLFMLKIRQIRNDFIKPTFLPKNEWKNLTLLLVDLFSFGFWKKVKIPKRHFEINWPLRCLVKSSMEFDISYIFFLGKNIAFAQLLWHFFSHFFLLSS